METSEIKNKPILIDTNVLVYCWDKTWGFEAKKLLRLLENNNNKLAISEFTVFELLKNASNSEARKYYLQLVNYIAKLSVTTELIGNAAILYHNYRNEWPKCNIESGDLIIGGTVTLNNGSLLLTANRKHFPMPFWKKVAQTHIIYDSGEGKELINLYLLEFDYSKLKIKQL